MLVSVCRARTLFSIIFSAKNRTVGKTLDLKVVINARFLSNSFNIETRNSIRKLKVKLFLVTTIVMIAFRICEFGAAK